MARNPGTRFIAAALVVGTAASWSQAQELEPATTNETTPQPDDESGATAAAPPTDDEGNAATAAPPTAAPPTKTECIDAHRQSQQAQQAGRLLEAHEFAVVCTHQACPGMLVQDCGRWLEELAQRTPSVVFEVRLDGRPNLEAEVWADGAPVPGWTSGEALLLDPGQHTFRFKLTSHAEVVQTVVLAEGMRYRPVTAEFTTPVESTPPLASNPPPAPASPPAARTHRPIPIAVYPLLGVGVLGMAGFTGFGIAGQAKQSDLESSCAPDCTEHDLSPMRRNYLIADLSLGVGVAALVGATVVYLGRPQKLLPTAQIGFAAVPGGGAATLTVKGF